MDDSRKDKADHFYSLFKEGNSVLDVGVSSEKTKGGPSLNYFLKNFRHPSHFYTGLGIADLSNMPNLFPGKKFVEYDGYDFPFEDKEFDWVFSNAVIEHVGDDDAQLHFLNEMMRVSRNVFFTTPNKYFPIESHTNALFLHWNNYIFYRWCKKYKPNWNKDNVYLFSGNRLNTIMSNSQASTFEVFPNRTLGIPMTYTVVCSN